MPTYPNGGPQVTAEFLLKQPRMLARRLTSLTHQRYIGDKILAKGSPESVLGGVARYQRAESIFLDRSVEKTAPRTEFPRAGWSEELRTAEVEQMGLEVPINGLSIRRNQIDQVERALIKLANGVVDFVDGLVVAMFLADADVLTGAGADWGTDGQVFVDVAKAMKAIREQNQGYVPDTLILHEDQHLDLMSDEKVQAAMPRESLSNPAMTGWMAPFMGLRQILVSNKVPTGKAILCQSGMVGTIADEAPAPEEGYSTYTPEVGPSISVKVYEETKTDDHIVRAARWPAMWLAEPKSAYILTSV